MKSLMVSVVAFGLASSLIGCVPESDSPSESTTSSDVTENADNYVLSCTPLALRTCDNPGACDTGVRLSFGSIVHVGQMDWTTRMAHLTAPAGWALADGTDGDPYLSVNKTAHCL
jgi:hypothetical protein